MKVLNITSVDQNRNMHTILQENIPELNKKKKNADPLFEVGVNEMPVQSTHDDMATSHAISGAGLLIPLGVDTIVAIYPETVVPLLLV